MFDNITYLTVPVDQRDHILGSPDAVATLLEYGDYECPHCGLAHVQVKRLLGEIGNQIRFSFRNFPLSEIHPHARRAALAAEAAAMQGRFWEMHNLILEQQRAGLGDDKLFALAESLDLDSDQFLRDIESPELSNRLQEDFMNGVRSGVNGTPTFFVNGRRHDGPADFKSLLIAIRTNPS